MSTIKIAAILATIIMLLLSATAIATDNVGKPLALPFDGNASSVVTAAGMRTSNTALGSPGDLVDFGQSIINAGNYLKKMQADVTEDNAGNGSGVSESPDDPDDAGWDWRVMSPPAPFFHTTAASPKNLYGVTALGLYYAYLKTNDVSYFTAMQDAANWMIADAGIRSAGDMKFLMLYDDLPAVSGTTYQDAAKAKYDGRIAVYGSAGALARYIRDARGVTQGYPNGIIGWDVGAFAVVAQMLDDRYGSYAADADSIAEVLWQDSFNDTPGLFDVVDDAGWDQDYGDVNFYWYTLGISGLLDAFRASGSHTAEIPDLISRLQASQYSNGAISFSYGAHSAYGYPTYDEDWQSTAYAVRSFFDYNPVTYKAEIAHGAYWTAVTQDVSGGWKYSSDYHYPEIAAENAGAVTLGVAPDEVWVDASWASQEDVDVYNVANTTSLVWGFDAFAVIANGITGVASGGTVNVFAGNYNEVNITINKAISVIGDPGTCGPGPNAPVIQGTSSGTTERGFIITAGTDNVLIDGFVIENYGGIPNTGGGSCGIFAWGTSADPITNVTVQNCEFNHIRWAGVFFFNEGHSIFDNIQINCNIVNMDDGLADNANSYGIECTNCKNSVISNNTVDGGWTGILMTAQAIEAVRPPVTVENNTISGNTVTGSVAWTGNVGIVSVRDRITNTALIQNITVSGNHIANSVDAGYGAFGIRAYGSGGGTFAGTMKVFNNSFTGNATKSLDNLTGILWDASGNYWGSNDAAVVAASVSSNVDYTPWMANAGTILNPGFNGDFSLLSIDDNSPQFGATTRLIEAIGMVSGSTIYLAPGTYAEGPQVVIGSNLTIIGADKTTVTIVPTANTGASGDARGWFLVKNGIEFNLSNVTLDGSGFKIYQGIRMFGSGTIDNNIFKFIAYEQSGPAYMGTGVAITANNNVVLSQNAFSNIGRVGVLIVGPGLPATATVTDNSFTGKGIGPWLDYGVELNGGATATVTDNNFADCRGIVSIWTSAGAAVTASTALGTNGLFQGNTFTNSAAGIAIGSGALDNSVVTVTNGNIFDGNDYGIQTNEAAGINLTMTDNTFLHNQTGLLNMGGSLSALSNVFSNTTNASDSKPGNTYNQNCWSDWSGVGTYAIGGGGGNIDADPSADCVLDMIPNSIAYNCDGNFTFDVAIGSTIAGLDAANIHIVYPAELTVANVTGASGNYFVAYTQTNHVAGQKDTLKVNLGVLTGVQDGPATLFTVAMNGSTSICAANQLQMIYADLRDSTNSQITAPLATPTTFISDCNDPDIVVNSPVAGGYYNVPPVLNLTATDDCDLDAVYYQIDACLPGGWLPIATGLSGMAYGPANWALPGFAGLTEATHCVRFKVIDDFGRGNADSCSFTWCFTKDVTLPAPPTNLTATPGHNKVHLNWTNASSDYNHTVVMRTDWYAGGHGYPEYDDDNAEGPYPIDITTGDQVYTGTGSTQIDISDLSNATRDVYHYAAFTVDNAGNVSAPSTGARSTSYWLGDIKSAYDGSVYSQDLIPFSSSYGKQHGDLGYNNEADFGPTHNMSPKGIPLTDSKVEFEDLVIFSINFDAVSPLIKTRPLFTGIPMRRETALRLTQRMTASTLDIDLYLDNRDDRAKAILAEVTYDPTKLEYVSVVEGNELAASQLPVFFKALTSPTQISVSAAVLGNGSTFDGSGLIATISFRLLGSGRTTVKLTRADIRDKDNRSIAAEDIQLPEADIIASVDVPATYEIEQNQPNPFNPETVIKYALPSATQASVRIYNVVGQLVKTLVDDYQPAGRHQVIWNGTNENGERVASGIYLYRFETPDYQKTIKMTLLK